MISYRIKPPKNIRKRVENFTSLSPSAIIRRTEQDIRAIERSRKYKIHMGIWYNFPHQERACHVCAAGAVMVKTLGLEYEKGSFSIDKDINKKGYLYAPSPTTIEQRWNHKIDRILWALDAIRKMERLSLHGGLLDLGVKIEDVHRILPEFLTGAKKAQTPYIPIYERDKKLFKDNLLYLADILEREGY